MAQMLPRLSLMADERAITIGYVEDLSAIVRTFALDVLPQLAVGNEELRVWELVLLKEVELNGSPEVRSRVRKLLVKP